MKTISVAFARALIDFAPTAKAREQGFGESQLHGAVAAFNLLARNGVAYLADEVGMGKTFVALGVAGLLRHLEPTARVMVIAPSENIQRKWVKELLNFVRENWQLEDNRVKGLDGRPVFDPVVCGSIDELGAAARINDDRDLFLRMTTFSLAVRSAEGRRRLRHRIQRLLPWATRRLLSSSDPFVFRDAYGHILNALLPEIDLLIVDEAHNLKHGYGPRVSNRNRVLGLALGHPTGDGPSYPWYGRRVKRALLLSATPFEYDYGDIYNQLDVLGFGGISLSNAAGKEPRRVSMLQDPAVAETGKRDLIRRLLLRRVSYLRIADEKYTKNRYRREWRQGGYAEHDQPMALTDPKERLIVGLVQKKVAEVLGDRRFNNQFQIGMLSSFESFLESMSRSRRRHTPVNVDEDADEDPVFDDGDQEATNVERQGIDTASLEQVVTSYRKTFGRGLPHPKLDATASALAHAFDTGEKTLIFARRIATVGELKAKLDRFFDSWIRDHMMAALPGLEREIAAIFDRYEEEQRQQDTSRLERDSSHPGVDQVEEDLLLPFEEDEGGTDSFFAWFYRGEGPDGLLSGAAFQKNRLSSTASVYSTVFEDDHVSWLLGRPSATLDALADALQRPRVHVDEELRQRAFGAFKRRTKQARGYPRFYVFEAYQVAALQMLADAQGKYAAKARIILDERYTSHDGTRLPPPKKFPPPEDGIGVVTFFAELVKRRELRDKIWPQPPVSLDFRQRFIDQERRRELISAMARLGAPYIDLYLLAIRRLGGFKVRRQAESEHPELQLIGDFLDLLERQATQSGFHAFYELSSAAEAFDSIVAANFPEVHHKRLSDLPAVFGRSLQHQLPVGGMSGGVNKRLVRQFRMPGFPLVMISTDVLQQGEDLHTFCKKVIHYGITWTPSAMEQRTGRIDRIGGLVQRHLDGRGTPPNPDELIQVYLPHLQDTVEVFQVRRVLQRLNKFLRLIHRKRPEDQVDDTRIDVAEELLMPSEPIPVIQGVLESAFPVEKEWLSGKLGSGDVVQPRTKELESFLAKQWQLLLERHKIRPVVAGSRRRLAGVAVLVEGKPIPADATAGDGEVRYQPFELELTSQVLGSHTLLRCTSPVGQLDLNDQYILDQLYDLQFDLGMVKICAVHDVKKRAYDVTVRGERMFDVKTTQFAEVEQLVLSTVQYADRIEQELLWTDEDARMWLGRTREAADA